MRVVLDECLPRPLGDLLKGHRVTSVQKEGWAGVTNGRLLKSIADAGLDALVTVDKNLPSQHSIRSLRFGIVVVRARSNKLADLAPLAPKILEVLKSLRPGAVVVVSARRRRRS
ncbi:MAG: hypothetical protein A4S17_04120 [Proteobacteria bacterium HN_bin10]|nr:MAG: hypothetical protein A4S17_04120 [Proteobacteria bacterium HN_bin10]